jgi:XTP/dITP diphosphohydrolase
MQIILASDNKDKIREFRQILEDPPWQIRSMRQSGFTGMIEENGTSYQENALIKARTVHQQTGGLVLSDDSGLSIDVLDGAPGLHSARFAGVDADYPTKIARLYSWLKPYSSDRWQARFVCALAAVFPDGTEETVMAEVKGMIAPRPRGENGFGYDPIFLLPQHNCTMAELKDEEKNRISHRGLALEAMARLLLDRMKRS